MMTRTKTGTLTRKQHAGRARPKAAAAPNQPQVNAPAPQATQGAQPAPRADEAPQAQVGGGAPNMMQAAIVAAVVQGIQQGLGGAVAEAMQGVRDEIRSSLAAPHPGLTRVARGLTNADVVATPADTALARMNTATVVAEGTAQGVVATATPQPTAALGAPPAPAPAATATAVPAAQTATPGESSSTPILTMLSKLPGKSSDGITSSSDPLDVAVPQKVRDKIWARQYVDLAALLLEDEQEMELRICHEADKASFRMVPKHKRDISTISQWQRAFRRYATVYLRKFPAEQPGVLKHLDFVSEMADENYSWATYDKAFRKRHATGGEEYGNINLGLYLNATKSSLRSQKGNDHDRDARGSSRKTSHPGGYCFQYHDGKRCRGCDFKHTCYRCGGDHPASKCPKEANKGKPRFQHRGSKDAS